MTVKNKKQKTKVKNASIEQMWFGEEKILTKETYSSESYIKALNWYNYFYDIKKCISVLIKYAKSIENKEYTKKLKNINKTNPPPSLRSSAALAQMILNESYLPKEKIELLHLFYDNLEETNINEKEKPVNNVSVYDRMLEKAGIVIGELEGMIDDADRGEVPNFYEYMEKQEIKGKLADLIIPHFKRQLDELLELKSLRKSDQKTDDLIEGYNHLNNKQLAHRISIFQTVVEHSNAIIQNTKKTKKPRKPRKVKGKPASQLVDKLKYKTEDRTLMIKSTNPEAIIGATTLITYNDKKNTLTLFMSQSSNGLTVAGTSIKNYDDYKSESMKCGHKAPFYIEELMKQGSKTKTIKYFRNICKKKIKYTNRLNQHDLILKVF